MKRYAVLKIERQNILKALFLILKAMEVDPNADVANTLLNVQRIGDDRSEKSFRSKMK
jgi:hypothetical protein